MTARKQKNTITSTTGGIHVMPNHVHRIIILKDVDRRGDTLCSPAFNLDSKSGRSKQRPYATSENQGAASSAPTKALHMKKQNAITPPTGEFILYQTEDGRTRIEVRMQDETVWLTQKQMAELFDKDTDTIGLHIRNIYKEGELTPVGTTEESSVVQNEGGRQVRRSVSYYNLDVIISVGYRVKSHRGTQFRIWATQRLREYIIKGFTMDDERLKNLPGKGQTDYFDEQLARIRDIRSSERRFYQKVLDIYATSVDYSPNTEMSQQFFATVQNKMHWACHGHTAAEVIYQRVDAAKPHMGLVSTRPGGIVRKEDVAVAKNYLTEDELHALNRIVNAYIEFAELQALRRKVMTMHDWIAKLDDFLKLADRELLDHAGTVSAETAKAKAELEYERYRTLIDALPRPVDLDFLEAAKRIEEEAIILQGSANNLTNACNSFHTHKLLYALHNLDASTWIDEIDRAYLNR